MLCTVFQYFLLSTTCVPSFMFIRLLYQKLSWVVESILRPSWVRGHRSGIWIPRPECSNPIACHSDKLGTVAFIIIFNFLMVLYFLYPLISSKNLIETKSKDEEVRDPKVIWKQVNFCLFIVNILSKLSAYIGKYSILSVHPKKWWWQGWLYLYFFPERHFLGRYSHRTDI